MHNEAQNQSAVRLDTGEVIRQRLPRHSRYIPRFLVRGLAKLICEDELNEVARLHGHKTGVDFANGVIDYLQAGIKVEGEENLPKPGDGRYIFVSNHPMGGLDGLAIISLIGSRFGGDVKFLVNDLLMAVTPLKDVFLPINKFGKQSRGAAGQIEAAYSGNGQMLTFPAGLCSRLHDDGTVSDLTWQKSFVTKAVEYGRDIVPMYFEGENSKMFYRVARLRKRLKLKFNIEMMLLPREMVKCRGRQFTLRVGKPIASSTLNAAAPLAEAEGIRKICYALAGR